MSEFARFFEAQYGPDVLGEDGYLELLQKRADLKRELDFVEAAIANAAQYRSNRTAALYAWQARERVID